MSSSCIATQTMSLLRLAGGLLGWPVYRPLDLQLSKLWKEWRSWRSTFCVSDKQLDEAADGAAVMTAYASVLGGQKSKVLVLMSQGVEPEAFCLLLVLLVLLGRY